MSNNDTPRADKKKRQHVARSARILSTGLSATAILGMTAAYGAAEKKAASIDETGSADVSSFSTLGGTLPPAPGLAPLGSAATTPTISPESVASVSSAQQPVAVGASGQAASTRPTILATLPAGTVTTPADVAAPAETTSPATTPTPAETAAPVQAVAPIETTPPVQTVAPVAPAAPPVQLTVPVTAPQGRTSGSN